MHDEIVMALRDERVQDVVVPAVVNRPVRVTRASTCSAGAVVESMARRPQRRRRLLVPARVRIMAWLVLLLFVALLTVVIVTRNLLVAETQRDATAALYQETEEFRQVAAAGVDRATGQPYANGEELLRRHIARQYLDEDEIVLGVTRDGALVNQPGRDTDVRVARDNLLAQVARAPMVSGTVEGPDGTLRWAKVPMLDEAGAPDGTFVVAYAADADAGEVEDTMRTLVVVSALGLLLAAIGSWLVSGQILAPVNAVRRAAAQIGSDDLTARIDVRGRDDIAALADQFNGMLDRLEQAFATQRQFLDDASHELRTPITIIRGNLELLDDDDPRERAEVVRLCTDELDRMSRIVEDLLLLAKSRRPDFVVPGEVSLVDLTSDIDAKLRALAPRRWLLEAIAEGAGRLDAQRVTQAVVQLAHNAVQHTARGDAIRFGSAVCGHEVVFWIADSGPGVRPEDADTIFDRFSRGSTGGADGSSTGAGLGLTIVNAIAQAHGGHIELESVPGAGARFAVHLPQADVEPQTSPS